MKKRIRIFLVFILLSAFSCGTAFSQVLMSSDALYDYLYYEVLTPLFEALKKGDVEALKYYASGDLYKKSKVLIEQNKDYPIFLRKLYKNSTFYIQHIEKQNDEVIVEIEIRLETGSKSYKKLVFKLDQGTHTRNWKAVRQLNE